MSRFTLSRLFLDQPEETVVFLKQPTLETNECPTRPTPLFGLGTQANAFYFCDVLAVGIVNDFVGQIPVMVRAGEENFHAYIRQVGNQVLTFRLEGDRLIDQETGSSWNISHGLATAGPLKGQGLQGVPSSFDWAWRDFYPESDFYRPAG